MKKNKTKVKLFKDKKWMWITFGVLAFMMAFVLIWMNTYQPLPEQFDAETVESDAKQAIEYFNERDYQGIIDLSQGLMDDTVTVEQFKAQCDTLLDDLGAFVEYTEVKLVGAVDRNTEAEYGGAIIKAKYEDGKAKFTIAFNEEMQLAQFLVQ